ncbi:GCN5-related N-acetyltransferase (GNAT) domain-containingprotein [Purpureocillium lavendulum]|uniref:GCN5-related N-acetyltransferase (GNAT) domain-containingprotein n=1 Tax=Purpureocillium lavendulum TaxID=1247861 RepID=A0AB34FIJ3_9HYPO|nr:GCN5-related N-acetyltransferase (GNAT) domain-containingprotein [Purpureocillium lavendulum]
MPLQVLPASAPDVHRAVAIEKRAYGPNPNSAALFPGPFPADEDGSSGNDKARVNTLLTQLREDPDACRWGKVVDTDLDGDMVAFTMCYFWTTPRDALPPRPAWGPGTNPEACELFFGQLRDEWLARMAGKPHAYLKLLHTEPEHQGRGAGTMLLRWLAAEADRLGLPTYLEASEEGAPLYEKNGFRRVATIYADLSPWHGSAAAETVLMLRPAA